MKHLKFKWHEAVRRLISVYSWNTKELKYAYFCSKSKCWFRSGNKPALLCKWCQKKPTKIRRVYWFMALGRSLKAFIEELK